MREEQPYRITRIVCDWCKRALLGEEIARHQDVGWVEFRRIEMENMQSIHDFCSTACTLAWIKDDQLRKEIVNA